MAPSGCSTQGLNHEWQVGLGQMPAFQGKLTDSEVDVILTYIKTWWTSNQRDGQADISQRYQEALDRQKKNR